jgi:membrane protease YdiL (CAAX protease family)
MNFVQQANQGKNSWSRYLLTTLLTVGAFIGIGQIPLAWLMLSKSQDLIDVPSLTEYQWPELIGYNSYLIGLLFPFITALITLVLCIRYVHKRPILSLFTSRSQFDWKRFFFSFFLWGLFLSITLLVMVQIGYPISWNFNPETFFPLLLISIFILPLQTTFEEVLFRGYILQGLGSIYKKGWMLILITGVLFGLLHGANPEVEKIGNILLVYYIVTGAFLGIIAIMDDGLELPLGYHAINNVFAALILTNDWQAFHTDALFMDKSGPSFGIENIVAIVVVQPLLLLVFSKTYRWSNWKKKLV